MCFVSESSKLRVRGPKGWLGDVHVPFLERARSSIMCGINLVDGGVGGWEGRILRRTLSLYTTITDHQKPILLAQHHQRAD
jgi:hypothetical protein